MDDDDLLTEREVADYTRLSEVTLRRRRRAGTGPAWVRLGRQYRYRRGDVRAWLASQPGTAGAGSGVAS